MKRYIIERRVNPFDEWKPDRKFTDWTKAKQSFEMLKKHRANYLKDSEYMLYRLFDKVKNIHYA